MVIRGRTRGNGRQLAGYLMAAGENDHVQILDVCGREEAKDNDLRNALLTMSLTSELTKSNKGLYHAQINPAYGDDQKMDAQTWCQAADILGKELSLEDQRRIIVLHNKKGRTHAHVVWERYDHKTKKMKSDSYSRLAQDRARQEMEKLFDHRPTPERNQKRPELKKALSHLWQAFSEGGDFVRAAKKAGYLIAAGLRRSFMVVDETGRSFDLARQLEGVKTNDVRKKLEAENLIAEKDAIAFIRQNEKLEAARQGEASEAVAANDNAQAVAGLFAGNKGTITSDIQDNSFEAEKKAIAEKFLATKKNLATSQKPIEPGKPASVANDFSDNRNQQLAMDETKRKREVFLQNMKSKKDKEKHSDLTPEPD